MRFEVRRTSGITTDGELPCEEAVKGELIATPYTNPNGQTHMNHHQSYYVELETLDDLLSFAAKYGEIIIERENWRAEFHPLLKGVPFIEIYDDYRE